MKRGDYAGKFKRYNEQIEAKILEYIGEYIRIHGYSPSYREIGQGVGLRSASTVHNHMMRGFDRGEIETDLPDRFSVPRAFRIARGGEQ